MRPCSQAAAAAVASTAAAAPLPCGAVTRGEAAGRRASRVPRRVHLGRGHGGPPDRGRQRQQRLVGLGARPRVGHASSRAATPATPSHRWREDVAPRGGHRPRGLPLLARVEPDRAGRGGVLHRRARALPADLRGLPRPRDPARRHVPPLHDPAAGSPPAAGGKRPMPRSASPASSSGRRRYLGDLIGWACTINEPNVVAVMGYFQGEYPPGVKDDFTRYAAVNEAMVRAHRLAVDVACVPARGTSRSGSRSPWRRSPPPRAVRRCATPPRRCSRTSSCGATGGDDFVGVQCYTRMHFGPDGLAPNDPDVPVTQMGDERWPQAVEHTVRRAAAVSGRPGRRHRERDRHRRRRRADRLRLRRPPKRAPLPGRRASTCGATSSGACWTISSGTWATAPSSGWWRWPRAPSSAGPSRARTGSARWPGATACARQVPDGVTGRELAAPLGLAVPIPTAASC